MNLTCIICPKGCLLTVETENGRVVSVTGNTCERGEKYAVSECVNPTRTLTTTARVAGGGMVSVKSDKPLMKGNLSEYMKIINKLSLLPPIHIGDIIIENINETGINIVATKNIKGVNYNA